MREQEEKGYMNMMNEYFVQSPIELGAAWEKAEDAFLNSLSAGENLSGYVIDPLPIFDEGAYSEIYDNSENGKYSYFLWGDSYFSDSSAFDEEKIFNGKVIDRCAEKKVFSFDEDRIISEQKSCQGGTEALEAVTLLPETGSYALAEENVFPEIGFERRREEKIFNAYAALNERETDGFLKTSLGGFSPEYISDARLFSFSLYAAGGFYEKEMFSENGDLFVPFLRTKNGETAINSCVKASCGGADFLRLSSNAFLGSAVNAEIHKADKNIIFLEAATDMLISSEEAKRIRGEGVTERGGASPRTEIRVDFSGMKNIINNETDADSLVADLTEAVREAVTAAAEGVYEL